MIVTTMGYLRNHDVLWRDTGEHVLVLLPGGETDVTVLGGGGAALWRLLAVPAHLDQLVHRLREAGNQQIDREQVAQCLAQLAARGILVTGTVEA